MKLNNLIFNSLILNGFEQVNKNENGEKYVDICEIHVEMAKTHSTTILEQIDSLLKWTGKKLDEIEDVIVSIGPGSFTGVRIAISVVKGLFFGRNVNFYEVNELDALDFRGIII